MADCEADVPLDMQLARRVAALRRAAKLSQKQLGAALGISSRQVQRYEAGLRMSAATLYRVCRCLSVPIAAAFEGVVDCAPVAPPKAPRSSGIKPRGFAAMAPDRLRSISAKGGSAKGGADASARHRAFTQNGDLARSAGRIDGGTKRKDN